MGILILFSKLLLFGIGMISLWLFLDKSWTFLLFSWKTKKSTVIFNEHLSRNIYDEYTIKRAVKYLIEGLMVAIVAFVIPQKPLKMEEIAIIALMAAATFSILDTFIPTMGVSARSGAGFGIGANLVKFPGGF